MSARVHESGSKMSAPRLFSFGGSSEVGSGSSVEREIELQAVTARRRAYPTYDADGKDWRQRSREPTNVTPLRGNSAAATRPVIADSEHDWAARHRSPEVPPRPCCRLGQGAIAKRLMRAEVVMEASELACDVLEVAEAETEEVVQALVLEGPALPTVQRGEFASIPPEGTYVHANFGPLNPGSTPENAV